MIADKLGYSQVADTTKVVKTTPAGFFGFTVVIGGDVTIYDNTAASGNVLFLKTGMTAGETIHFGGNGIASNIGLTAVVDTGTINLLYT